MKNTPNYELPQFEENDLFNISDFNKAFNDIDVAINDLQDTFNVNGSQGDMVVKEVLDARLGEDTLKTLTMKLNEACENFKTLVSSGGIINGDLKASSIGSNLDAYGLKLFVDEAQIEDKKQISLRPRGLNEQTGGIVLNGKTNVLHPYVSEEITLGNSSNKFKEIWLGGYYKNANGYCRLNSGLILQWGSVDSASNSQVINFPIAFPNTCLNMFGSNTSNEGIALGFNYFGKTQGNVYMSKTAPIKWVAIGH